MVEEHRLTKSVHEMAHAIEQDLSHVVHEVLDDLGPDHTFSDIVDRVAATSGNESEIEIQQRISRLASEAGMETNPDVIRPWAEAIHEGRYHPLRRDG